MFRPNYILNAYVCKNVIKRFAGHSKWQNIKHVKGANDAQRSLLFTKLSRQIRVAVQEGGSADPNKNLKLEQIIQQTKRANMPAATLQHVLKSCKDDKGSKKYMVEIKGAGGCFVLLEVYTNHLHMVRMNLGTILRKHQGKFGEGSGAYLFQEKGVIEAECPSEIKKTGNELLEYATDHAIESNSEDVTLMEDNVLQFVCGQSNLKSAVTALEALKYNILSATVEYLPIQTQLLQDSDLELVQKMCHKISEMPEFVRLFHNVQNE